MPLELLIDPPCAAWKGMMALRPGGSVLGRDLADWKRLTRDELGLPADRPIVAAGHAPIIWHPGILAKYLMADAFAKRVDGVAVNLVVDQDEALIDRVEFPIRDAAGRLSVATWKLTEARDGVPVGQMPAFAPPEPEWSEAAALECVREGLTAIKKAILDHRAATSAAMQVTGAVGELMRPWVASMPLVTAGALLKTSLGRTVIGRMMEDPQRFAAAHNAAAATVPEARIAPLAMIGSRVELPLWRIDPATKRRMTVMSTDAASESTLYPKALLMTLLMRLAACDLFIHGRGGGIYDRITEQWAREWLGVQIAPMAVVTATLRLPFPEAGMLTDPAAARWGLRRAWHDPRSIVERASISREKKMMQEAVDRTPRRSPQRRALYRMMHAHLVADREANQALIDDRRRRAEEAMAQASAREIIDRRDWAFPLYPASMIDELAAAIRATG